MSSKSIVVAVVVFAVIGWLGIGVVGATTPAHNSTAAPTVASAASTPVSSVARTTAQTASGLDLHSSNLAENMATNALAQTRALGLKANVVFVPRPSATPAQAAAAATADRVSPLYTGTPAPLGLAYYGLSGSGNSHLTASILNTTAVRGYVDANATGITGQDLFQSSPDAYGIQLNSVLTNVTLFGVGGYSFWTQNVVEYYPATHLMFLVDNVWNFSGGSYKGDEFYSHGPLGTNYYAELGYYYAEYEVPFPVYYPFNLTLTMNSGLNGGRDNMSFSTSLGSIAHPSENFTLNNWDYVVFNSLVGGLPVLTQPSPYTANGKQLNPIGLTNDFELDICGPGGGSQVDLSTADAQLGLAYLSGGSFVSVPAAYNYGGETGETAIGANVAWSSAAGGPAGLSDWGSATTGPAVMSGLWGLGAPQGSYPVTLIESPSNAFNFLQYSGLNAYAYPIVHEQQFAPTSTTSTLYLMPGNYTLLTELADYTSVNQSLTITGPTVVTVVLASDPALGDYTPLWAFSNAQVANLASSGTGTPSNPYVLYNTQNGLMSTLFGQYNDYTFPVFPGVFLYDTSVSVEILNPPHFNARTSHFAFPGLYLPTGNDLQYWIWNSTGVSIVDAANISGWFGAYTFYPSVFDTFNVIFYEGGHNLIAGNTFNSMGGGSLLLFSGGNVFTYPINIGGGNNTVWGNTFDVVNQPGCFYVFACEVLLPTYYGLGIQVAENNDLIYNNYIASPTTAWELPLNLYSGYPEFFSIEWNITPTSASTVNYAAGFPYVALTGSIVGGTVQGGNFWWDYGVTFNPYNGADNPYNVLPYDENAPTLLVDVYGPAYYYATYIFPGGDYAPLVSPVAVGPTVTFTEKGLNAGTAWGVNVTVGDLEVGFVTTASYYSLDVFSPGKYSWSPALPLPAGYTAKGGKFKLTTSPVGVTVSYKVAAGYAYLTLRESGLPTGTSWSVQIEGTTPQTDAFDMTVTSTSTTAKVVVVDGTYTYTVPGVPGWAPSPSGGSLTVTGATTLHVTYHAVTYTLSFSETGLPAGKRWGVEISGPVTGKGTESRTAHSSSATVTFSVANGSYTYSILPPRGYTCAPSSGSVSIAGEGQSVSLVCTASPIHAGAPSAATGLGLSGLAASVRMATARAA